MLEYDKVYIFEGTDVNKSNASKECDICHYWHFLNKNFNIYESYLFNGCCDSVQKAMNFNDTDIVSVKGIDYRIHFWYISKDDAINIMKNSNLNKKADYYYQRNRETILNRAKEYFKNNKEVLRQQARNK